MTMAMVMWNIHDANADEDAEGIWVDQLPGELPKPSIGEKFVMTRDHRGPYDDGECVLVSGRVKDMRTDIFPSRFGTDVHISIYLDIEELTNWDAEKSEPVEIEI